jgi:dolichol-phosphate mannosyltransferase
MRVLVIIPTYNEAQTIHPIVTATLDLELKPDVLVVDDNSPDGTGNIVAGMAAQDARVSVLHRPAKQGLGTAYVLGFRHALVGDYDVVVEMDGDGSHNPAYLPALIDALVDGDVAIGSRYVPGGGIAGWGMGRRLISLGGNRLARRVLRLSVADCTSGLRAYRRTVLEAIDLDSVGLQGYAFQVAMVYAAVALGFRVREVPIVFEDRWGGESKMSLPIILEAGLYLGRVLLADGVGRIFKLGEG